MGIAKRLKKSSNGNNNKGKKPSKPKFVPGFSSLGPTIYVQDPALEKTCADIPHRPTIPIKSLSSSSRIPQSQGSANGTPPDLIIITSWTGAIPKHIAKYTQSYNQLFPGVPIMVITTNIGDLAWHRTKTKLAVLAPAVSYLTTTPGSTTPRFSQILLHAFSEGGANKAVCLAQAFQLATTNHTRLPISAFIFDSTPGTPRYSSNVAAFRRSLPPNKFAQTVGLPLGACVLGVTWFVFCIVVGYDNNLISKTRRALNDNSLWEVGSNIPRTYLFSESDDLIFWKDVEDHGVTSAQTCGARSLLVRFKNTGHCGHARGNEEIYWGAVKRTWETRHHGGGHEMIEVGGGSEADRQYGLGCGWCLLCYQLAPLQLTQA
ncbi:Eukaryotic protein of unknown function (DUF829) domain containing protein [Naviculisporaceae sp. PSN 640]